MYHNLDVEMAKAKIKQWELAEKMGVTPTTLSLKLNGKSDLSLRECIFIKKTINSNLPIEILFKPDELFNHKQTIE